MGRSTTPIFPSRCATVSTPFNRVRLLPSGWLAKVGFQALGIADRADQEGWRGWEVRSLLKIRPIRVNEFPLDEDASLLFSTDGSTGLEFVPRGGARVTSDVLVFRGSTVEDTDEIPQTLALIGTGSLKDRDRRLFVAVSVAAAITPHEGCRVREFGSSEDTRRSRSMAKFRFRSAETPMISMRAPNRPNPPASSSTALDIRTSAPIIPSTLAAPPSKSNVAI